MADAQEQYVFLLDQSSTRQYALKQNEDGDVIAFHAFEKDGTPIACPPHSYIYAYADGIKARRGLPDEITFGELKLYKHYPGEKLNCNVTLYRIRTDGKGHARHAVSRSAQFAGTSALLQFDGDSNETLRFTMTEQSRQRLQQFHPGMGATSFNALPANEMFGYDGYEASMRDILSAPLRVNNHPPQATAAREWLSIAVQNTPLPRSEQDKLWTAKADKIIPADKAVQFIQKRLRKPS